MSRRKECIEFKLNRLVIASDRSSLRNLLYLNTSFCCYSWIPDEVSISWGCARCRSRYP